MNSDELLELVTYAVHTMSDEQLDKLSFMVYCEQLERKLGFMEDEDNETAQKIYFTED